MEPTGVVLSSWKLQQQGDKRIKHNEPQGLGVGCAMFKKKTKNNGWEKNYSNVCKEKNHRSQSYQ